MGLVAEEASFLLTALNNPGFHAFVNPLLPLLIDGDLTSDENMLIRKHLYAKNCSPHQTILEDEMLMTMLTLSVPHPSSAASNTQRNSCGMRSPYPAPAPPPPPPLHCLNSNIAKGLRTLDGGPGSKFGTNMKFGKLVLVRSLLICYPIGNYPEEAPLFFL